MNEEHYLQEFEKNQKWFMENFDNILKKYREKFVAVWHQKVVGANPDLKRLSKNVREKTKDAKGVYIGYVSEKPLEMIL